MGEFPQQILEIGANRALCGPEGAFLVSKEPTPRRATVEIRSTGGSLYSGRGLAVKRWPFGEKIFAWRR
jgi:hypothetical protein